MEAVDYDVVRKRIHDAIADILGEEDTVDSVLAGWVLVFESAHLDGERSFTLVSADATGERQISPWVGEGFLYHAAHNYEYYEGCVGMDDDEEETDEEDDET